MSHIVRLLNVELPLPACAWLIAIWLNLDPLERLMLVLFAALPPASAAFVMAVRMGGDGRLVGLIFSIGTPIAAITIPF
jgi:predicted permease